MTLVSEVSLSPSGPVPSNRSHPLLPMWVSDFQVPTLYKLRQVRQGYKKGSGSRLILNISQHFSRVPDENHKKVSQDSLFLDRYSNAGPPEYKAAVLTTRRCVSNYNGFEQRPKQSTE